MNVRTPPTVRDLPPTLYAAIPTKEQAECCLAQRDALGRLPIGFCGPGCIRREARRLFLIVAGEATRARTQVGTGWWVQIDRYPDYEPDVDPWDDPVGDEVAARMELVNR